VLVAGGLVWTGTLVRANEPGITAGRDPRTGEIKRERPPDSEFFVVGMGHHRCHRNRATERYLVLGRAGVEFVDLATGKGIANHWVRGTCQYGVIPCNGLLYAPPHSCACFIQAKLNGFNALAATRQSPPPSGARLVRGPAYGAAIATAPGGADWPTYRGDAVRSGRAMAPVPAALKPAWRTDLGGRLSSIVSAEGKTFVAQIDTHTVHALDASSGARVWSYTAGGRVDSPPTIHNGLALFGCADGWVYCLRASDGQLVWRFRAAPEERRVVSYDQIESAWPVPGSVLVQDGVAYLAAGRSSFLDGGMYLCRLDVKTGQELSETRIDDRDPKTGEEPQATVRGTDMPGALPDVLSSDGQYVYMRHRRFDRNGVEQEPNVPHMFSPAGFLDDAWWHRTYWFLGTKMQSGWGSWPRVGNATQAGRLLVFDSSSVYGFGRSAYATSGAHVGVQPDVRYRLFGAARELEAVQPPPQAATKQKRAQAQPTTRVRYHWVQEVPLIARAMILAEETLFIAGPPDSPDRDDDGLAALQGGKGGVLWAVSAADGTKSREYKLAAPPVFDSMVAANGRLYLATTDGEVLCFAGG
jgi:outer membrane protein assembly factor BamB